MELWFAIKMLRGNIKKMLFPLGGVVFGIISLIITISISDGGKNVINSNLSAIGENRIMIGGDGFTRRDIEILENFQVVEYVIFPNSKKKVGDINYIAYPKKAFKTMGLENINNNEIILDKKQFDNQTKGDIIELNLESYEKQFIIADFYEEKNPFELMKTGKRVIISQENFENLFGEENYKEMVISFYEGEEAEMYINHIFQRIKSEKGPYFNLELLETPEVYKKIIKIKNMVGMTLGIISIVSLTIGGLGIFNLIASSINSRLSEIGILRAVGMKEKTVVKIFITEAFIIGIIGSVVGIIFGINLSIAIGKMIKIMPIFNILKIVLGILVSISFGVIMGVFPTKKIRNCDIIKILKEESN